MAFTHKRPGWTDVSDALSQITPLLEIEGTPGNDRIKGSFSADYIDVSQDGKDRVGGSLGDDTVYFGAAFTGADRVTGGGGVDTVILDGDYSAGVAVQTDSFAKVERLVLEGGSYVITGELNFQTASGSTVVDPSHLTAGQSLNLDVSSLGQLHVSAGAGDDVLHASANGHASYLFGYDGDDTLIGGSGASEMAGFHGADTIIMSNSLDIAYYENVLDSTARSHDTIENFAASGGKIELGLDSDTATPGLQHDFHFGKTADRTGDILFKYDAEKDETVLKVFTDADHKVDMVIHLTGDVPLTPADFIFG